MRKTLSPRQPLWLYVEVFAGADVVLEEEGCLKSTRAAQAVQDAGEESRNKAIAILHLLVMSGVRRVRHVQAFECFVRRARQ